MLKSEGAKCDHQRLTGQFQIQRVGPRGEALIDLSVICADCAEPFIFTIGDPSPTVIRLAIMPASAIERRALDPTKRIIVPELVGANGH